MTSKGRILVVDDEPDLRDLLTTSLSFAGFEASGVASGRAALDVLAQSQVRLIIMDVMMPTMDGVTTVRKLRARGDHTPVLFLTAKDHPDDVVAALGVGGDDYVTKPFSLAEVVARIEAILRRTSTTETSGPLTYADIEMDEDAHEVTRAGQALDLTPMEFSLLRHLMLNAERVQSKAQLLEHVWGYEADTDGNIVETYISYLRRKLDAPFDTPLLHTKRGVGYVLRRRP